MSEQSTDNTLAGLGAHLRKLRELQGLEVSQVAGELRLLESHILELESGDYNYIKSPVFARGYLRQYAQRLGIDPEEAVQWFDRASTGLFRTETAFPRLRRRRSLLPTLLGWAVVGLGVAALVALGWYLFGVYRDSMVTVSAPVPTAAVPVTVLEEPPPAAMPAAETFEQPAADLATTAPATDVAPSVPDAQPPIAAPVESAVSAPVPAESAPSTVPLEPSAVADTALQMSFTGDCWVEVRDATREILLADLKKAGDQVRLQGVPPYTVLLGNAAAVRVTFQGQAIPVVAEPGKFTASLTVGG